MSNLKLGLRETSGAIYLFVGGSDNEEADSNYMWYKWNGEKKIPVYERCLVGYLTGIRVHAKHFKGKDNIKIDVSISADFDYVIRTGADTTFARGLILGLENLGRVDGMPLSISVSPGDDGKVVFCEVNNAEATDYNKFEWNKNKKLFTIIQGLQKLLGQEVQGNEALRSKETIEKQGNR